MDISDKQTQLNKIFKEKNVILAYIFGSAAKGKEGFLSDLDVAVFFDYKVAEKDYLNKELDIKYEIGKLSAIKRVDVITLNKINNPLLMYNIVLCGRPIFVKDQRLKAILERKALREYEDTAYLRNVSYQIMRRQIKEGIFGIAKA